MNIIDTVLKEFLKIAEIPRPSHHEEKIGEYLYNWALKNNLAVQKGEMGEIIIDKPASKGYEKAPKTILQAHMDMVCVSSEGVEFNPLNDPIKVINDGTYLMADGTSLGADDGIGIAMSLYLLQDKSLKHGAIRAIFTTNEEDGMDSAMMKPEHLDGDFLINLDWETIGSLCNSCAGGDFFNYKCKTEWTAPNNSDVAMTIEFKDLLGGHSGVGINKGHANAIVTIATLLSMMRQKNVEFRVASFSGGMAKNAIPGNAIAKITIDENAISKVNGIVEHFKSEFVDAFGDIEKEYKFFISVERDLPKVVLNDEIGYAMVELMTTVPNNVHTMSPFIDGLVESSANLGVVEISDEEIAFTVFARSSVQYQATQLGIICEALANGFGFEFESEGHVTGWAVNPNSKLTDIACNSYKEITGKDMIVEPVHAGVECGAFAEKNPKLDMISIGPTLIDVHTPNEKCVIEDVKTTTHLLIKILEKIAD